MHFLVAIDGSSESAAALERAATIASPGGSLTVVHAVNPDVYDVGGMEPIAGIDDANDRLVMESIEDAEERGMDLLEEAAEDAVEYDVSVETDLLYGPPADRIVEYAREHDVDGIYLGHRGLSERLEGLLGSVAKTVTERSPVPVTIVR